MADRNNDFSTSGVSGSSTGAAGAWDTQNIEGDGLPVGTIAKLLLAALVVGAVVIFVLQNLDNVPVNFLSWSFDAPLILLLAVAGGAGILLRWIVSFIRSRRRKA